MRAPISVVIPTLNAEAPLTGCLTALMEGLEAGLVAPATARIAAGVRWRHGASAS